VSHPRIAARAALAYLDSKLPDFAPRGACAGLAPNRAPWSPMFEDDVAFRKDGDYEWPKGVREAMQVCASCPVRRECLAWAFDVEKRESRDWWTSELIVNNRRYGVLGGTPGRIRERFQDDPDPIAACDEWFVGFAEQNRWDVKDLATRENMTA
jgi:hypothetical protein